MPDPVHELIEEEAATLREGVTRYSVKTYVVMQYMHLSSRAKKKNLHNVRLVTVKLTLADAQKVVDEIPSTFIIKRVAYR